MDHKSQESSLVCIKHKSDIENILIQEHKAYRFFSNSIRSKKLEKNTFFISKDILSVLTVMMLIYYSKSLQGRLNGN
ncbi:MAG: hypothetical protein M3P17_01800 [Thermoproteota archaeon]|nr:hypothetical protein [Thermoproteota archaeon]